MLQDYGITSARPAALYKGAGDTIQARQARQDPGCSIIGSRQTAEHKSCNTCSDCRRIAAGCHESNLQRKPEATAEPGASSPGCHGYKGQDCRNLLSQRPDIVCDRTLTGELIAGACSINIGQPPGWEQLLKSSSTRTGNIRRCCSAGTGTA